MGRKNRSHSPSRVRDGRPEEAAPTAAESVNSQSDGSASVQTELSEKLEQELTPVLGDAVKREQVIKAVKHVVRTEFYNGPVPHPQHFESYEAACPGAGLRLIGMAETALERGENRNDKIVASEQFYRLSCLWAAVLVLMSFLVAGTILCATGHETIGASILVLSGLTTIASRFIDGHRPATSRSKDAPPPQQ
ncbi:MAG: hypothetical protein ABL893_20555, partial [Hyphomicrobium sp.]